MVLLSASPAGHGGKTVLATALKSAPSFSGEVKASLSVPSFNSNFDANVGELTNEGLKTKLKEAINSLLA